MNPRARLFAVTIAGICLGGNLAAARADTLNVAADAQTNSKKLTLKGGIDPAMTVCNTPTCNLQAGAVFTSFARFDLSPLPAGATVDNVQLDPAAPAAGRTLKDLDIRKNTGATVIAIARSGEAVTNPGPDFTLQADDIVVLGR